MKNAWCLYICTSMSLPCKPSVGKQLDVCLGSLRVQYLFCILGHNTLNTAVVIHIQ
jgi:hypothetical protein